MLIDNFLTLAGTALDISIAGALSILAYAIAVAVLILVYAYIFGWVERKLIAKMQLRHGPTTTGKYGIFQNLADFIKLLSKEHTVPRNADKLLLLASLPLMLSISIFLVLLLPLSPSLSGANLSLGLLVVFVVLSFMPLIIFINGFGSSNKFAEISAQRSMIMLLSYEVPLLLIIASVALLANSYNISGIVSAQSNRWFLVSMPIGFVVFFIVMLAELERSPLDLREADSELIAGWLTDISAPYYSLALFLDYTRMFFGSLIIAILFLGGWQGPVLPPLIWLLLKAALISLAIIIVRATMVRMRLDRLLRLGWIALLPLALLNLIITYILFVS